MKFSPATVHIPPRYSAYVFRGFNLSAASDQPSEVIKVVFAASLQHAHDEVKRFELEQGLDFDFRYLGNDTSYLLYRSEYHIESLF